MRLSVGWEGLGGSRRDQSWRGADQDGKEKPWPEVRSGAWLRSVVQACAFGVCSPQRHELLLFPFSSQTWHLPQEESAADVRAV